MNDATTRAKRLSHWRLGRRHWVGLLAFLAMVAGEAAHAVQCVPLASGVPFLSGAPNFLVDTGEPNYWPRVDDPRWVGALSHGWGDGASLQVLFRVLRTQGVGSALYLSWVVKVAPQLSLGQDRLLVAFGTSAGNAQMIEVNPQATARTWDPPPSTASWSRTGGNWNLNATTPTWLASLALNTRISVDPTNSKWAINMKVPLVDTFGPGIGLPADLPFAFRVYVTHPMNGVPDYGLPDGVTLINNDMPDSDPGTWETFNIAPSSSTVCDPVIRIAPSDVGTTYVDSMNNPHPNRIGVYGANKFFALPDNTTGSTVQAGKIRATFRIANWGTQPTNAVTDPATTLWKKISPDPPDPSSPKNAGDIGPHCKAEDVTCNPAIGNGIHFDWSVPDPCEFTGQIGVSGMETEDHQPILHPPGGCTNPNPTRWLHQCMLVELTGANLTFNPASVYRNMDFVNASSFQRKAEVSVAGLTPLSGGAPKRDVYLYVQTFQMPKYVGASERYSTMFDLAKVQAILDRSKRDPKRSASAAVEVPAPKRPALGVDFETLDQQFPTYLVHAFHDTGKTEVVHGRTLRVLRPQTSFGYYVHHDGPLAGWETYLEGAGQIEQIAPNYYRVAVPVGGTETVTTRIVAREYDRYAVWLAFGQTFPHGSFGNLQESGPAATVGFEYALSAVTSLEGTLGTHRFNGKEGVADIDVTQYGVNGKWTLVRQGLTPFVTLGAGAYAFDPGSTRFGVNVGAGVQYPFAPQWSVEGRYVAHHIAGNAPNTNYSTLQIGLRYAF